jgi:hypothetical protein
MFCEKLCAEEPRSVARYDITLAIANGIAWFSTVSPRTANPAIQEEIARLRTRLTELHLETRRFRLCPNRSTLPIQTLRAFASEDYAQRGLQTSDHSRRRVNKQMAAFDGFQAPEKQNLPAAHVRARSTTGGA